MSSDIWILGATGRSGRGIARLLHSTGHPLVLAGRDETRLASMAAELGGPTTVTGTYEALLARVNVEAPSVVVNTVGPFARTSVPGIEACPPGTHYVDIGNELAGVQGVLDAHDRAVARGSTFVTGGGFGVLATESILLRVCEGHSTPSRVRVDAVPSLATEQGIIGSALAGSMLESAPDGGRRVEHGRLVRFPVAGAPQQLTTPSGQTATTSSLPTGDLLAAWRASQADDVISATSAIPSSAALRTAFPLVSLVMRWSRLRRLAINQLARVSIPQRERATEFSWGHATAEWSDGTIREGWLRLGDAQHFTDAAAAEIARRLSEGKGRPGAFTPAALFGASLASDVGGEFFV